MLREFTVRLLCSLLFLWPALGVQAQESRPLILRRDVYLVAPAIPAASGPVVFGSSIAPDGAMLPVIDLWAASPAPGGPAPRRLTRLEGVPRSAQGVSAVSVSSDGARAAFTASLPAGAKGGEEVHVIDIASGADRTVTVDTTGCIQVLCVDCFVTCVNTPHLTPDGASVLFSVSQNQPFRTVRADGTALKTLPVYQGALAPGPQRVITTGGVVVFTSAAPFGPTFAAAPQDVYLVNLDGTNIRAVTRLGTDASLFAANATISADGGTIVFESNLDPGTGKPVGVRQILAVRADGNGLRALTTGTAASTSPSLSADGTAVAFARAGQIWFVRSDGTGLRQLTNLKLSAAQDPVLSSDGSLVVFALGPSGGGLAAIYSVRTDGTNLGPVYAPRGVTPNGITAWGSAAAPSPGAVFSAWGTNLSSDGIAEAGRFPLPESLGGLSLMVNGVAAPLLAVTPWQVDAQLPPNTAAGTAAFQFKFADGTVAAAGSAEVKPYSPAIFSRSDGATCQAAVLHAGGALADRANPAAPGETVEIYGTGLGPVDPFVAAGVPAPVSPLARAAKPEVRIGQAAAEVVFSGLTPGLAGVYQVNAIIPVGLRPGAYALTWSIGGVTSSGCGTIAIR